MNAATETFAASEVTINEVVTDDATQEAFEQEAFEQEAFEHEGFEIESEREVRAIAATGEGAEEKLRMVCEAAAEMKARDIVVLDVRGQTIIADFFVMCSGTSLTHIQSIAEGVRDHLREDARERAKPEGDAQSYWVILDYSDVILHVFSEETREFYDLERLWSDAKITRWDSSPQDDTSNHDARPLQIGVTQPPAQTTSAWPTVSLSAESNQDGAN